MTLFKMPLTKLSRYDILNNMLTSTDYKYKEYFLVTIANYKIRLGGSEIRFPTLFGVAAVVK